MEARPRVQTTKIRAVWGDQLGTCFEVPVGMPASATRSRSLFTFALFLSAMWVGCGGSSYNIPPAELRRIVALPPAQRGEQVRVYPDDIEPKGIGGAPPPVVSANPSPEQSTPALEVEAVDSDSRITILEVLPSGHGHGEARSAVPPAASRTVPAPRGITPSPAIPIRGHGVPHASAGHVGGHGGHSGGGANAAIGVAVGVVALVVVVAVIAAAAQSETPFDGWVRVSAAQPIHLEYTSGYAREVALSELCVADLAGVKKARLHGFEGSVERLWKVGEPPGSATVSP